MGTQTTNKEYIATVLCGGTFFTLLLQAGKQGLNERNVYGTKRTAFKESDLLEALIKIASPSYERPEDDANFRSVVSTYKTCKTDKTGRLPVTEPAIIVAFDNRIKTDYITPAAAMSDFVVTFVDVEVKGEWLVKALLELISADHTILSSDEFCIYPDGRKCTKLFMAGLSKICLSSFLLGIWHFIVTKRKDNTIGKATFDSWHSAAASKGAKREFISEIGASIQKQITLQPFVMDSTRNAKTDTTDNAEFAEDAAATVEASVVAGGFGTQYTQKNYSPTINVGINTGIINGIVFNKDTKED